MICLALFIACLLIAILVRNARSRQPVARPELPVTLSEQEASRLALAHAPDLLTVPGEFFDLELVVVVLHPQKPLVGYHLIWKDDIDFSWVPWGDPSDHEVVWAEYEPATSRLSAIWTYWHGTVLCRAYDSSHPQGEHPEVLVQWGKHGSLPDDWEKRFSIRPKLELMLHYLLCTYVGGRNRTHASADWPARFVGTYRDYTRFEHRINLSGRISPENIFIGTDANAFVAVRFHRPFSRKTQWPY